VAVPSPLSVNVTPDGNVPVLASDVVVGKPAVVVTANDPAPPTVKVAWLALVITGETSTNSVNTCDADGVNPFAAFNVN